VCVRRGKRDVLIVGRDGGGRHGSRRVGIHFDVIKKERRVVTAGPEIALVASLVRRVTRGDAPKEEES
jgi:hypothetical protein